MKRIAIILLIILNFLLILSILSNHFDFDFGWHLRFGQDFTQTGKFPYLDTYTFTHFGQRWINHEWGNDILTWTLYKYCGYWLLNILSALAVLGSFLVALKIFFKKITVTQLIVTALLASSVQHILVTRPAMYSLFFFAVLWFLLERLPQKPAYLFFPIIIWFWSLLHGGWVLGFIVIAAYFVGNIFNALCKKFIPNWRQNINEWNKKTYLYVALSTVVAVLLLLINPYGLDIIKEVASYFQQDYFKSHIIEWIPSYTYPIFWSTLFVSAVALVIASIGLFYKRISWPQFFLLIALFCSGWQYKRNMLFLMIVAAPVIVAGLNWMAERIKNSLNWQAGSWPKIIKLGWGLGIFIIIALITLFALRTRWSNDVWRDETLLNRYQTPVAVAKFLNNTQANERLLIFNEFAWGAPLIWQVPQALYFLDGRGTATWKIDGTNSTTLEVYLDILQTNGLDQLKNYPVNYVILQKSNVGFYKPDAINKLIFSASDLKQILDTSPTKLEKDLRVSPDWNLVFEDGISLVWKKIK